MLPSNYTIESFLGNNQNTNEEDDSAFEIKPLIAVIKKNKKRGSEQDENQNEKDHKNSLI